MSSKLTTLVLGLNVYIPSYNLYVCSSDFLVRKWCMKIPSLGFGHKGVILMSNALGFHLSFHGFGWALRRLSKLWFGAQELDIHGLIWTRDQVITEV
jgi:hypothetical protein